MTASSRSQSNGAVEIGCHSPSLPSGGFDMHNMLSVNAKFMLIQINAALLGVVELLA